MPVDPITLDLAKRLRACTILPEYHFWKLLSQQFQAKFLRQQVIGQHIVDIYCPEYDLIIELGGDVHDYKYDHANRSSIFQKQGLTYLCFGHNEIKKEQASVLHQISNNLTASKLQKGSEYFAP